MLIELYNFNLKFYNKEHKKIDLLHQIVELAT